MDTLQLRQLPSLLFHRSESDSSSSESSTASSGPTITPVIAGAIAAGIAADILLTIFFVHLYIKHRRRRRAIDRQRQRMEESATTRRRASRWLSGLVLLGRSPSSASQKSYRSTSSDSSDTSMTELKAGGKAKMATISEEDAGQPSVRTLGNGKSIRELRVDRSAVATAIEEDWERDLERGSVAQSVEEESEELDFGNVLRNPVTPKTPRRMGWTWEQEDMPKEMREKARVPSRTGSMSRGF